MKQTGIKLFSFMLAIIMVFGINMPYVNEAYAEETATTAAQADEALDEDEKRIEELLDSMTLSEKIAQMLMVYLPSDAKAVQKERQYGGYVLFANSFKNSSKDKMKSKIKGFQKVSDINMLIAVDEEGGSVVRASKYKQFRSAPFKSPRKVYQSGGWNAIKKDAENKSIFLTSLGINTNLAPVADVAYSSGNFIYNRSFSTNVKSTSKFIKWEYFIYIAWLLQ